MRRLLPHFALMMTLAAVGGGALPAMAEGEFNMVGSFNLPGDLEVITSESHTRPNVTVDTWVKAGSAADFQGFPGLANATALALWEGGKTPLSQAIAALGGTSKAEVYRDATHFSVTVPAAQMTAAMDLIGAAFSSPDWANLDLSGLKSRLAADYAREQADVPKQAFEKLLGQLYGPDYGHSVVGQPESYTQFTLGDLQAFYNRYYVPGHIKVVLTGDFDTGKTVGQVVRSYAAMLKRTPSSGQLPARPLAPSTERPVDGAEAHLAAGARGPAIGDQREQATMSMVATVLGNGNRSRLGKALGDQARAMRAYWVPFKGPGVLVVQVVADPKNTMAIEKAVRDALGELRTSPVSLDEHARAMAAVVAAYEKQNDTLAEQAETLGFFSSVAGDPLLARTFPEVVRQVSRQDMMEAAQKYLTPDAVRVVVLAP